MLGRARASQSISVVETIINVVVPPLAVALGVMGFFVLKALSKPVPREVPEQPLPVVQTAGVVKHSGGLELTTDGLVVPYREIQLAVEVDGRIVEKTPQCEAGTFVTKGTLLLRVDKTDYEIEVNRLREQLRQAEAALAEWTVDVQNAQKLLEIAQQQLEIAKRDYQRAERLFGNNAIPQAEFDNARKSLLLAEQEVVNLENQLRMKQASKDRLEAVRDQAAVQLQKAQIDLARTEIRAPSDGVVVSDLVEENTYVRKGTTVLTFEDTSCAQVNCQLTMRQVAWLWAMLEGSSVDAKLATGEAYKVPKLPVTVEYELDGRVFYWEGTLDGYEGLGVDDRTRMVPCRILVPNPTAVKAKVVAGTGTEASASTRQPPALVRGMYVSVRIHVNPTMTVLRVPQQALQPGNVVGRVRDGKLRMVAVEFAQMIPEGALIIAPPEVLREGDSVAVSPTPFVENNPLAFSDEGLPVEVQSVL